MPATMPMRCPLRSNSGEAIVIAGVPVSEEREMGWMYVPELPRLNHVCVA